MYSLAQIAKRTGLSADTLGGWHRAGLLMKVPKPRNQYRCYDRRALRAAYVGKLLLQAGVRGPTLHKAVRFVAHADLPRRVADGQRWLYLTAQQVFLCRDGDELTRQEGTGTPGHHAFLVVDLAAVLELFAAPSRPAVEEGEKKRTAEVAVPS